MKLPTKNTAIRRNIEDRPHDITIFGCTGNAGRAIALYAIKSALISPQEQQQPRRICLAGRNKSKIQSTIDGIYKELDISSSSSFVQEKLTVTIFKADINTPSSISELTKSTHVLFNCVGPYGRYGELVISSCIDHVTHYADLTGEVPWVEEMISKYEEKAREVGVVLMPFAGFDCIPSELGTYLAVKALRNLIDNEEGDAAAAAGDSGGGEKIEAEDDDDEKEEKKSEGNGKTMSLPFSTTKNEKKEESGTIIKDVSLVFEFDNANGGVPRGTAQTFIDGVNHFFNPKPKKRAKKYSIHPILDDAPFNSPEYNTVIASALSPRHFLLPEWSDVRNEYTAPDFMSPINIPVLYRAGSSIGLDSNVVISDRLKLFNTSHSFLSYWGFIPVQLSILMALFGSIFLLLPPVRWMFQLLLDRYSYDGHANGQITMDAQVTSKDEKWKGLCHMVIPGDAGIYCTGLIGASVANVLLDLTTTKEDSPGNIEKKTSSLVTPPQPPLVGFHSPVDGFTSSTKNVELLVTNLEQLGAEITLGARKSCAL